MHNQHNWQLLSFILIMGLMVGWTTGQLVGLLIPTGPAPPQTFPSAGGPTEHGCIRWA
jgi:hypothetical protein